MAATIPALAIVAVTPVMPLPDPAQVGPRKARPRRSKNAQREVERIRALSHRAAERSRTRALQDVAALMCDDPVLVATDPTRMVKPLLAKDGPVERRAKRMAAEAAGKPFPPVPKSVLDAESVREFVLTAEKKRAQTRNLHATRFGLRIRRTKVMCERIGAVHMTPGHEGTTAGCPACPRVRPKTLGQRWHRCPCGLVMPRDQASAIITLGRAVLAFRDGPDPGGLLADKREAETKARAKRDKRRAAMTAGAAKARATRSAAKAATQKGGENTSSPQGVVPLGRLGQTRKRVRNQGRNVWRVG